MIPGSNDKLDRATVSGGGGVMTMTRKIQGDVTVTSQAESVQHSGRHLYFMR